MGSHYQTSSGGNRWKKLLVGSTIYQKILRIYAVTIVIGSFFLATPISSQKFQWENIFDAFFTSISAFTNTGLSVNTVSETFNFFGQLIILILIQVGGTGTLTVFSWLWASIKKKASITSSEHRLFVDYERGGSNSVDSFDVVKTGILVLLITEAIGAYFLTIFFYFDGTAKGLWKSIWWGIFHSASAANNAGFDLFGSESIKCFNSGIKNLVSVIFLVEAIIGGIGYPMFYEIRRYVKGRRIGERIRFSLSFKINMVAYFTVAFVGAVLGFIFEVGNSTTGMSAADRLWNVIYLTFSSRSSGFSGMKITDLKESTQWLLICLMFIGANPASTGGGIRAIIIFIIFSKFFSTCLGKKHLSIFKKTVRPEIILSSYQVLILSGALVSLSVFVLLLSAPGTKISDAIFESSSAFGTAGLTSDLTAKANWAGRAMLTLLMFIGQLGSYNALISITDLKSKWRDCEYDSPNIRIT